MRAKEKTYFESIKEFIKTILFALLIAGIIRTLFFQPFWIPSGSMKPNLLIGDYIFVNKFTYGYSKYSCPFSLCPFEGRIFYSEPKRGDVVVFRHPANGKDYVKRLIGLPGDEISMKNGRLTLNGKKIDTQKINFFIEKKEKQGPLESIPRCSNAPVSLGAECMKKQYLEEIEEGLKVRVLDISDEEYGDNITSLTVPKDNFFFIGDNRDNSLDSRFSRAAGGVGFVKSENLIGRAEGILFSSAGKRLISFWSWRKDRFFKAVNWNSIQIKKNYVKI